MRRIILFLVLATVGSVQAAKFKHDSLIVKFAKGTNVKSFARSMGVQSSELLHEELNLHLLKLDNVVNFEATLSNLKNNPEIIYVQKNHLLSRRGTPSDPEYNKLWSLMTQPNNSDAKLPQAWDITTGGKDKLGNEIVVAVIDGGVDFSHEDLEGNTWVNKGEIPGNNKDDDGNGYVDDINGWNAAEDNGQVDVDRHGTHVAGIIGAEGGNDLGIVGVNWNVKVMGVSLFDFSTAEVVRAYSYVLKQKKLFIESNGTKGANVVSTNSSFGVDRADCQSRDFPMWNDLYNQMGEYGIISAAATINGNQDVDAIGDVPTGCSSEYILAVTNTNIDNEKYREAGYGKTFIDVGAPGTDIYSTLPDNDYGHMTGTSMATPHVAGMIGLLHSGASKKFSQDYLANPSRLALTLKGIIMDNVDSLPSLKGKTVSGGRINVQKSMQVISQY